MKQFYVYITANKPQGTLYIGVTSNLPERIGQHRSKAIEGFSKKYETDKLMWYEIHDNAEAAISREKQLKEWKRDWKKNLIEQDNPHWEDLYETICK